MEDNTVRVNENEEYESETEIEEVPESSSSGAIVAGIVGGFLAYAVIGGSKKLVIFMRDKLAEWKQKEAIKNMVEANYTVVPDKQQDSEEESESK